MIRKLLSKLSKKFSSPSYDDMESEEGYLELDTEGAETKAKVLVKPFVLDDFEDVKPVLDALREGRTIALINIKPLKDRDILELKRVVNKLKKTADAVNGEIAGFGEDYLVLTPSFATIYRTKQTKEVKEDSGVKE